MILVMLGTQNNSFHRLLEEVEKNIENGTIQEDVIVQAGYTKYESQNILIIVYKILYNTDNIPCILNIFFWSKFLNSLQCPF